MTPEKREFKEAFIQLLPKAWQRVSEMLEVKLRTSRSGALRCRR